MESPASISRVNVHQAKTQLSRLIAAAHAAETIVLAKAGKPWARLSAAVHGLLVDPTSEIWVSADCIWDLSLMHHRGQLPELAGAISDLPSLLQAAGLKGLPIRQAHGLRAGAYSQPHRNPFDRVLAAQTELERLVPLTADPQLTTFAGQTLW